MSLRRYSQETVLGIFRSRDMHKNVAIDFGVSCSTVTMIKNGKRYGDVTAAYEATQQINAALVTAAFTIEAFT